MTPDWRAPVRAALERPMRAGAVPGLIVLRAPGGQAAEADLASVCSAT